MPSSPSTVSYPLSLHDALPISRWSPRAGSAGRCLRPPAARRCAGRGSPTRCARRWAPARPASSRSPPRAADTTGTSSRSRSHRPRSEEHTSELQSLTNLVCRLLPPPYPTPFPYTTLFRSPDGHPEPGLQGVAFAHRQLEGVPVEDLRRVARVDGLRPGRRLHGALHVQQIRQERRVGRDHTVQDRKSTRLNSSH